MKKYTIDYAINGRHLETKALAPIYPGMLLERYDDGVRPHSVEEGIAPPLIAMENRLGGTDISIPYEPADIVYMRYCLQGDVFIGLTTLLDLAPHDLVCSKGDGFLERIPEGNLADGVIVGRVLAAPATIEAYSYFAINGLSLDEVYGQAEGFFYLINQQTVTLDNFIPIEVL
jgi:hypothetical protein